MDKETADKVLSELGRLHSIEEIKFSLLRIKADIQALDVAVNEILGSIIGLQENGVKKLEAQKEAQNNE